MMFSVMMSVGVNAQRVMDKLDRGLVAMKTDAGIFCSWRIMGEEYYDVTYNIYRDGTKLNSEPLKTSNFTDASGSTSSKYTVSAVVRGKEQAQCKAVTPWEQNYLEIVPDHSPLKSRFEPNDACVADVDGDGEMEIIIKMWNRTDTDAGCPKEGVNGGEYNVIEVYKLNGKKLWWINCGPNLGDFQYNETNIVAYDWDGDGKAEALMRAADGTTIHMADGTEYVIGDKTKNYRAATSSGQWFVHDGDEFLVYMNGETGKPYQVMTYPLTRESAGAWGDDYGHRSSKYFFGAPYLDGKKPSIFLGRGIYTRHKFAALDVDPSTHQLTIRWRWECNDSSSPWYGNGYHNYQIADVDWDGRDEIIYGSMVIDDNGKGLSTTGLGHGDAQHCSDFNPYVHGQEIFACLEDHPGNNYRDATTSKLYYRYTAGDDDGRSMMGNFTNDFPGSQGVSSRDPNLIGSVINGPLPGGTKNNITQNFRIFWDGDLLEETHDYSNGKNTAIGIYKYGVGMIDKLDGSMTNNDTKGSPTYQGDILGDWREEVITRTLNNTIRIYSTTIPTEWRNYTLWHDHQYRNSMVWQMCGYNQPPHASYFLGEVEGITVAPPALTMTDRTEVKNGASIGSSLNDKQVMLREQGNVTVSVNDGAAPYIFFDNAPSWVQGTDENGTSGFDAPINYTYYTHTLTGGAFTGEMRLVKQGDGTLTLPNVTQTYTGNTDVWAGVLNFDGTMQNSRVWLNRFAELNSNGGKFQKGIEMDYAAILRPGGANNQGTIETDSLILNFGSRVVFDVYANGSADKVKANVLTIEKKDWQNGPEYDSPVFEIVRHNEGASANLPEGKYLLAEVGQVKGNLDDIKLEGKSGLKSKLTYEEGKLYFVVEPLRKASVVYWDGAEKAIWDFANTENFKQENGQNDIFVTGDIVQFGDNATSAEINLLEEVVPSSIVFDNSAKDFVLNGTGSITGNATLTKKGTGNATINNVNYFTGNVTLNGGKLTAASLANTVGTDYGALGGVNNTIIFDGGTLSVPSAMNIGHKLTVGYNGGSLEVQKGTVIMNSPIERLGANVNAALHKTGSGTLTLSTGNKFSALYVDGGTVNIIEPASSVMSTPDTIVFSGKNVVVADANNSYSYSKNNAHYKVLEGATGSLYLDGRCDYSGTLSGKGQLTVYATYVRNYLNGNWSAFEGTLVANHSGSSYEFSWNNSYGLPKATLNIASGTTFTCSKSTLTLGALSGSGTLNMTGNLSVGGNNQDVNFAGTFGGKVNVFKEGTGAWTFSKAIAANEYVFKGGTIRLNNTSLKTSLFGSAVATVQDNCTMIGLGTVGNIRFMEGSVLQPGNYTAARRYGAIASTGFIYLYPGSKLNLMLFSNINNQYSRSYLTVGGVLQLNGELNVELGEDFVPASGDEFVLWTAKTFSGTPSKINLPALPDGLEWDTTDLLASTGILRVTGEATGIRTLNADQLDGKIYSLDGRRVDTPKKGGIYIKNGKKFIAK